MRRALAATALPLVLLAGLTACTAEDAPETDEPTAVETNPMGMPIDNPTSEPTPPVLEQATAGCTDGEAVVADLNNHEVTVPDCARVVVTSSNALIHLGATEELVVDGAINGIDVASVERVTVTGDGNRVTTGSDPEITDEGRQNTIGR